MGADTFDHRDFTVDCVVRLDKPRLQVAGVTESLFITCAVSVELKRKAVVLFLQLVRQRH